jgi:GT2 family glycosyltransferase
MNTLLGISTYGGIEFTKLAVKAALENTSRKLDLFIVVGKYDDEATIRYAEENNIPHVIHTSNWGFPKSVNDIYEYGWVMHDYDNVIIMGNDVLPYPNAIDSLIDVAETTDYELICASEYDVRALCSEFPHVRKFFRGDNYIFEQFDQEPWKEYPRYDEPLSIADPSIANVQNLCLYKRSVFEKIGYTDVNFYPAYYIDNDYARRAVNAQIKSCTLRNAVYFHFWSRTIKQGSGGSTNRQFDNNKSYYISKWGGDFGQETSLIPFNGQGSLGIHDRSHEQDTIKYWQGRS